jgi:hypothetical protein
LLLAASIAAHYNQRTTPTRMIMNRIPFPVIVLTFAMAMPAAAQQVTLERDSPLYAAPRLEGEPVAQLKRGESGEVLGKQGAWLNLKTPAATGWLFSFNVRFPAQKAEGGDQGAGAALGRVVGPRRSVSVTSSIGIRGIEEEDLKQARFDAEQIKLLDSYAVTREAAEERARAAGLAPVKLDYLGSKK